MAPDPHEAALFLAVTGAAVLMALSGIYKSVLEWRPRRRTCPSCGRQVGFRGACPCR